jgi:protein-S-isoprenylcysteine O-methyltransferase Ste14
VFALTLGTARNIALAGVVGFLALGIITALVLRSIAQKVAVAMVFGLLAVLAWSQRASLDDCADRVRDSVAAGAVTDTTCSFLGRDVTVKAPRAA